MTKHPAYAAYDDSTIYAIADTPDLALERARSAIGDESSPLQTAQIGDDLAEWIAKNGWNGHVNSFEVRKGFIVDTTGEQ